VLSASKEKAGKLPSGGGTEIIMNMKKETLEQIKVQIKRVQKINGFYAKLLEGIDVDSIQSQEDFEKLPFSEKANLRDAYPLGLAVVPEEDIVRIHSSSGTTGTPVIIPYTQKDVDDWAELFRRCYEIAGLTNTDRIHITPGYGLWTAGIGFQLGAEKLGAMTIPMGPGNTDKQIKFMEDMKSTVLCATSSYALLLAEEIQKRNVKNKIHLRKGIIGSERWGEKMRNRIANELGVELYDIYGLTEVYGPGIAINCEHNTGMHYFDDFLYFEIIDPKTGEVLPDGELGELVITTLQKEGAPLIRYRTHDLTKIIPGTCPCGRSYPRIDVILGRTDDMVKVKGVNIFPGQIDDLLKELNGASSEYQVFIEHADGKDRMTVFVETELVDDERAAFETSLKEHFKSRIGLGIVPKAVSIGDLPRSEKKSTRIYDYRY
jgi:Coenzyme F390 synthetase